MLHVVVHHRDDPKQTFVNEWHDADRLKSIETTPEIGRHCASAQRRNERVKVHRCGWGANEPTICCSVAVVSIEPFVGRNVKVTFGDALVLLEEPAVMPEQGQSFYFAR